MVYIVQDSDKHNYRCYCVSVAGKVTTNEELEDMLESGNPSIFISDVRLHSRVLITLGSGLCMTIILCLVLSRSLATSYLLCRMYCWYKADDKFYVNTCTSIISSRICGSKPDVSHYHSVS